MKKNMYFAAIVISGLLLGPVAVAAQPGLPGPTIVLRVEPGDTLLTLFGDDWLRAWTGNQIYVRRHGVLVSSPDILIAGTMLHVPRDIRMTPRALGRFQD